MSIVDQAGGKEAFRVWGSQKWRGPHPKGNRIGATQRLRDSAKRRLAVDDNAMRKAGVVSGWYGRS
jgi:hypothetical protein